MRNFYDKNGNLIPVPGKVGFQSTFVEPPRPLPASGERKQDRGIGDRVHEKLGPIGQKINWPCMKGDGTTNLKPISLCNFFRITLNKIKL